MCRRLPTAALRSTKFAAFMLDPPGAPPWDLHHSDVQTSSSESGNGSGLRSAPLITEKIAVFAPIPRARVRTPVVANPGFLNNPRAAIRSSLSHSAMTSTPPLVSLNGAGPRPLRPAPGLRALRTEKLAANRSVCAQYQTHRYPLGLSKYVSSRSPRMASRSSSGTTAARSHSAKRGGLGPPPLIGCRELPAGRPTCSVAPPATLSAAPYPHP